MIFIILVPYYTIIFTMKLGGCSIRYVYTKKQNNTPYLIINNKSRLKNGSLFYFFVVFFLTVFLGTFLLSSIIFRHSSTLSLSASTPLGIL